MTWNCQHMTYATAVCIARQLATMTGRRRRISSQRHSCGQLIWRIGLR